MEKTGCGILKSLMASVELKETMKMSRGLISGGGMFLARQELREGGPSPLTEDDSWGRGAEFRRLG